MSIKLAFVHSESSTHPMGNSKCLLLIFYFMPNHLLMLQKPMHLEVLKELPDKMKPASESKVPQNYFSKECDHFVNWPSPTSKRSCPNFYNLKDESVSIVIYLTDDLDSYPMQTFLSAIQFTKESRLVISNVVFTFINNSLAFDSHMRHVRAMMALTTESVRIVVTSSESERKAKLKGVDLANSEQVHVNP